MSAAPEPIKQLLSKPITPADDAVFASEQLQYLEALQNAIAAQISAIKAASASSAPANDTSADDAPAPPAALETSKAPTAPMAYNTPNTSPSSSSAPVAPMMGIPVANTMENGLVSQGNDDAATGKSAGNTEKIGEPELKQQVDIEMELEGSQPNPTEQQQQQKE